MASFSSTKVEECSTGKEDSEPINTFKKFPVGCDEDKEKIFCFPFILDKETISYIENHARIMFIIRGPPSTGKATLSEMITERYPNAIYCCADRYFTDSFSRSQRTRESIKESHVYCTKKVENACKSNVQSIIVQNTHMRKWEMQQYLDFANLYNYTVVMAITLYRFDCTPQALAENNTDGLDIRYFINRLRQWEDVPPLFTGWFIAPDDSQHILNRCLKAMELLLDDGKFCRVFEAYNLDDIRNYFNAQRKLYCLACFSKTPRFMKNYYLSDMVQASYGKSFSLYVVGYLVSTKNILGIVYVSKNMTHLLPNQNSGRESSPTDLTYLLNNLNIHHNLGEDITPFPQEEDLPNKNTLRFEDPYASKEIEASRCSFINLAVKDASKVDIESIQKEFVKSIQLISDENGCLSMTECPEVGSRDEDKVYKLPDEKWLIKLSRKICLESIFTGYYV